MSTCSRMREKKQIKKIIIERVISLTKHKVGNETKFNILQKVVSGGIEGHISNIEANIVERDYRDRDLFDVTYTVSFYQNEKLITISGVPEQSIFASMEEYEEFMEDQCRISENEEKNENMPDDGYHQAYNWNFLKHII